MEFEVKIPILGFENIKKLKLVKIDENFHILKPLDIEENISFTIINPFSIRNYDIEVPKSAKYLLKTNNTKDLLIFNILIINKNIKESTINFLAPIILNTKEALAGQIVLDMKTYPNYLINEKISKYLDKN